MTLTPTHVTEPVNLPAALRGAAMLPVIIIERAQDAVPLAAALHAGGIGVIEVTLRTGQAMAAIEAIATQLPEVCVGAGTVRSAEQARRAKSAGAQFAVSPGFREGLARDCAALGLPLIPGVATSSEVMAASEAGHGVLKFFPAQAAGGIPMLKAWAGPFPDVQFCPTGGLTLELARQYLALPNVSLCGGSWVAPSESLQAQDWPGITALARASAQALSAR